MNPDPIDMRLDTWQVMSDVVGFETVVVGYIISLQKLNKW
jgi:hypothetical protein